MPPKAARWILSSNSIRSTDDARATCSHVWFDVKKLGNAPQLRCRPCIVSRMSSQRLGGINQQPVPDASNASNASLPQINSRLAGHFAAKHAFAAAHGWHHEARDRLNSTEMLCSEASPASDGLRQNSKRGESKAQLRGTTSGVGHAKDASRDVAAPDARSDSS